MGGIFRIIAALIAITCRTERYRTVDRVPRSQPDPLQCIGHRYAQTVPEL